MSQLDDLDDLIASLDTGAQPPSAGAAGRRDSFDILLESLSGPSSPALNKRASRPVSRRLSRRPSSGAVVGHGGAPMPAGATASFEALLDSLSDPPPPPAAHSPPAGSPASRLSRPPVSSPSQPPAAHAAKDDDLLDQLLESLDIGGAAPAPAAAPAARGSGYQPAGNPRASLSQPARGAGGSPLQQQQPANPRASLRQEAAASFAGVEDSLDSLLAALDPSGSSPAAGSPAVSARRSVAPPAAAAAPARNVEPEDADFDKLLAQLGHASGEPAPARPISASTRRQPSQADMATLRPSFAETVRQSLPQPMHATLEELGAAGGWEEEHPQMQPSRASVVYLDERRGSAGHLQPQYATVESVDPPGYGQRPVSQHMSPQQQPYQPQQQPQQARASVGYGSGGAPHISPTPSPYMPAQAAPYSPPQSYSSPQQARYSQQPVQQQPPYQPQQPQYQPSYQPPQQSYPYQQQPQQQQHQPYQSPPQQQHYQQPQQHGYPYQQQQQPQQQQQGYPYQQQPQQQSYQPQGGYQQPMAASSYSTAGPRAPTPVVRPSEDFIGSVFEEDFKREVNMLRRDPQSYARMLETERRPYYQDKIYAAPGVQRLLTREGLPACDEAIHFLMSCQPVSPVEFDSGLCLAAKQAVTEGAPTGSTNISSLLHIQTYGVLTGEISELSKFGALTAREMLMTWVIGDGDASRLHRGVVMDPKWSKMGIAAAKHNSVYKTIGLATFCTGFESNTSVMDKMSNFNYLWNGASG